MRMVKPEAQLGLVEGACWSRRTRFRRRQSPGANPHKGGRINKGRGGLSRSRVPLSTPCRAVGSSRGIGFGGDVSMGRSVVNERGQPAARTGQEGGQDCAGRDRKLEEEVPQAGAGSCPRSRPRNFPRLHMQKDFEVATAHCIHCKRSETSPDSAGTMSAYKSFSKQKPNGQKQNGDEDTRPKNRQRVLMLSSRGVTHRFDQHLMSVCVTDADTYPPDTAISSPTSTRSSHTAAKTPSSTQRPN